MTTDIAIHPEKKIVTYSEAIASETESHNVMLTALQNMSIEDMRDNDNLWRLTKVALAAIRKLQNDLSRAQVELIARQDRIHRLEHIATTDELTGLVNRRGLMDAFDKELDRTNRGLSHGGLLLLIDLDNFKSVNDTYGHTAGDEALKLVSQTLNAHIRKMDVAARLGGDEFVLLFANAKRMNAVDRAQKLARKLNALTLKHDGHRIPVRASIGIESYTKGDTVERIFSQADAHMYRTKEARKN